MSKTYVLYHGGCPDGFGAAYAAWKSLGYEAEYIPVKYGEKPPELEELSQVYIVDFSYSPEEMLEIAGKADNLIVLDHHKTAFEKIEEFKEKQEDPDSEYWDRDLDFIILEKDESGAVMTWKYFHPEEAVPTLLLYVQDRDLWNWELEYSEEINTAISSFGFSFRVWDALREELEEPEAFISHVNTGHSLLKYKDSLVNSICYNAIKGFAINHGFEGPPDVYPDVPVVSTPILHSDVGHKLLEKYPDAPFSVTFRESPYTGEILDPETPRDHLVLRTYSLRSEDDREDVSAIAKKAGGGGHRNAAGFERVMRRAF